MVILGIDPGSRRVGYGLIESIGQKRKYLTAGLLDIQKKNEGQALEEVLIHLEKIINEWKPELCAIEKLFFVKNQTTGMAVGQTRGVILLALSKHHLPIREFSPKEMKSRVTGFGGADKKAVAKMTAAFLEQPNLKLIDDAWDALALALALSFEKKF